MTFPTKWVSIINRLMDTIGETATTAADICKIQKKRKSTKSQLDRFLKDIDDALIQGLTQKCDVFIDAKKPIVVSDTVTRKDGST